MSLQQERDIFRLGAANFALGIAVFEERTAFWDVVDLLSSYHADVEPLNALWLQRDHAPDSVLLAELCCNAADQIQIRPNPCRSPLAAWLLVSRAFANRILASDDVAAWELIHDWVDVPEDAFNEVPRAASTDWLDQVENRIGGYTAREPLKHPDWEDQIGWIHTRCQELLDDLPEEIKGPA